MVDPKALFSFSYGLYVVGTEFEGKLNAQVADAVMQLTSSPVCLAACLNKANYTAELLAKGGRFSISVLSEDAPMPFIGVFGFRSGRVFDKFANVAPDAWHKSDGVPVVTAHSVAAVEAEVVKVEDVETHMLFIGRVTSASVLSEARPLTYADYHKVKKGKSPANAPSVIFNSVS
ncbi:MAG: flavin reductase family protein [Synergistaceae bacterium]|jgi:ferric-chelate reductase [NAD(P)H]|nr:flavin reductase family protein [Synergistaceae bacterium]